MKSLKAFWSSYSPNVVKFWTNQVVMSILGISVGLATIALDNLVFAVIGSVFTVGILCYLQYDNAFQLGLKDHYRPVDVKRPKRSLGLKIAFLGSLPLFLLTVLGLIFRLLSLESPSVVTQLIYYAIHGSYIQTHAIVMGAFQAATVLNGVLNWLFCLAYTLPVILFSSIGYLLGAADKPLRTFFGMKYVPDSHDVKR